MCWWESFSFGCLGVLLLNCVQYLEIRKTPPVERPTDFGEKPYWIDFFGRALIGGTLAWVYWYDDQLSGPIAAMQIGVSAPLIMKAMFRLGVKLGGVEVPKNVD